MTASASLDLNAEPSTVLIVEDEASSVRLLNNILSESNLNVKLSINMQGSDCLEQAERIGADLILLDLGLPDKHGLHILKELKQKLPDVPVIIITVEDDSDMIVECMKEGAYDYITKPVNTLRTLASVRHALSERKQFLYIQQLRYPPSSSCVEEPEQGEVQTHSPAMVGILSYAQKISKTNSPILVCGETGSGKDNMAQTLHRLSGRKGKLVKVNIAGMNAGMLQNVFLGNTDSVLLLEGFSKPLTELGEDDSLYLDEVDAIPAETQALLLRIINLNQSTGSNSEERFRAGLFFSARPDRLENIESGLFYMIDSHRIELPPLRKRRQDIPIFFYHFLEQEAKKLKTSVPKIQSEVFTKLNAYPFPGNIRELKNMVSDLMIRHDDTKEWGMREISPYLYSDRGRTKIVRGRIDLDLGEDDRLPTLNEGIEQLIEKAMNRTKGNMSQAASILGMTRQALNYRLKRKSRKKA